MIRKLLFYLILGATTLLLDAQDTTRVLFLGNSYTATNNLPKIIAGLSNKAGKPIFYLSNTPGGSTLDGHLNDPNSLALIRRGTWDYIVLQEQSQIPTIPHFRDNLMFPAVQQLHDTIAEHAACARVIMFMTWGRQNGGQQCGPGGNYCSPVFQDFAHMQDSLKSAYQAAGRLINALIAPVGISWQKVIQDTSIALHSSDESHPNLSGSYLASCALFEVIQDTTSVGNNFTRGLSSNLASYLQSKAHAVVHDTNAFWNLNANPCPLNTRSAKSPPNKQLSLYPNPVKETLRVRMNGGLEIAKAQVVAMGGRTFPVSITNGVIDLSHLPAGLYALVLTNSDGLRITRKVRVE